MFENLILRHLPATARDLYALAQLHQPHDCVGGPCPHRHRASVTDLEWMHQLRRELQQIAVKDSLPKRNAVWR
jgi:hypothetical protein